MQPHENNLTHVHVYVTERSYTCIMDMDMYVQYAHYTSTFGICLYFSSSSPWSKLNCFSMYSASVKEEGRVG